jgi:flagellin
MDVAASVSSTLEFDPVKLKQGDKVDITITDAKGVETKMSYLHGEGNTMADIASFLLPAGSAFERKGNFLLYEGYSIKMEYTDTLDRPTETMRIQVGALENEQLNIEVRAMNTKGLNLDDFSIYTQDDAGNAITAVRAAVDAVSDQRALLGAMQNRMTYKINNINISAENLQAAESRIRDVDIAAEMSKFTSANIMAQAATAMLAQANAAPQNVLSLLR